MEIWKYIWKFLFMKEMNWLLLKRMMTYDSVLRLLQTF